ncbi:SH3 and cysteine-rich domain-containing protein 2-like isoform X2 [Myripristis murdjan]|uniref:SH3 and cysteine-rich domain-containing protein 2-like isoform X2 n=1 Tax=Myripristis murdjan TaxID=586833 RepID=UPI001175CA15|nr:SH3 and cysteine-rich domain-containing protein 2-like isoform X2 [Myripristis murdjan]
MMTENNEMDSDPQLQRSPSTMSIQPVSSKLQRLKRSLSFKSIMRSKSVENFFQRSYSDARLPPDFITDPPPPSPPLLPGSPLVGERSPSISPSLSPNPSVCSHSPSLSLSPSLPTKPPRPQITHCFQEHVFRKPTNCQHCKHMIVGNSKQALRCKTCKMAAHLWCTSELSQQPCYGKSGAFKRNFSSPMLVNDQLAVVKEVQPSQEAGRARVDPVYAALRYGTSLAQMSRSSFGSVSESPTRSLGEGSEDREQRQCSMEEEITPETGGKQCHMPMSPSVWICIFILCVYMCLHVHTHKLTCVVCVSKRKTLTEVVENYMNDCMSECVCVCVCLCVCVRLTLSKQIFFLLSDTAVPENEPEEEENAGSGQTQTPAEESSVKVPKRIEVHAIHTYVALYKFLPQEQNDLELQMKMSPPSAEDSAVAPLRTTNYKLGAHHCPHVELATELCSQQGTG